MIVRLESVNLPGSRHLSPSDGGQSAFGNNDKGRRLLANRERTAWRLVSLDGTPTLTGLFISEDFARAYAIGQGWQVEAPDGTD